MDQNIIRIINIVRSHRGNPPMQDLDDSHRLREDLGFDSIDLAELTARIEEHFEVDVFADGLVRTIGEIRAKIGNALTK